MVLRFHDSKVMDLDKTYQIISRIKPRINRLQVNEVVKMNEAIA